MSWSGSGTAKTVLDADGEANVVEIVFNCWPQGGNGEEESKKAVGIAKEAITYILMSGALGAPADFSVAASGHANTGNRPVSGWANDSLTISITQIAPVVA